MSTLKITGMTCDSCAVHVKDALEKVPGVRRLSPHSCRHTYVSALERCHVPMEMIARLTGHSDIRTTDRYLHIDDRTLQDAVAMLDPQETEKEKPL